MKYFSYVLPLLLMLSACAGGAEPHGHAHDAEAGHGHDHGPSVSHTVWTDKAELFVDYKPLVVGERSTFAAHFTEMEHFQPVAAGKVTASLIKDGKGIRHTVEAPSSPGLFRPALQPKEVGTYQLVFDLVAPGLTERITVGQVQVYPSMEAAAQQLPHPPEDPNAISFSKEQAWKIDFANVAARQDTIYEVIRAGGEFIATPGNEKTVSATATGILLYKKRNATIGSQVANGERLFAIAGGGIIDRDLEARFRKARSVFEQAKASFDRKAELYAGKAISKSEYEAAKLAYELAETELETLSANYSKGGKAVFAGQSGYLKQLFKLEGDFVEAGEPLAVITENKTVTLRADVAPGDYGRLSSIHSAKFIANGQTYSLDELDGKLLSYGKSVSRDQPKVPVYFELANTVDLLPGSFVEVFILLRPLSNGVLIPTSALLEDYGNYSVIVQRAGETFAQREIKVGVSDGQHIQVLSGLQAGERVVTTGAFQVKMAAMSGEVPAHGHAH